MTSERADENSVLASSQYFEKYILPDWMRRNPAAALVLVEQVRSDPEAEQEVQRHLKKMSEAKLRKAKKARAEQWR